jgi:hypothetical protein
MSAELDQQMLFFRLITVFSQWMLDNGYSCTDGEAWRSPEEAAIQAAKGAGVAHSLHTERMARDINAWKDSKQLLTANDYRPLGEQWKSMHSLARWGGDFARVDADHFSLTFGGVS